MFHTTTELMTHQAAAVGKLTLPRVGALFMDMGTGKSLTVLKLAEIRQEKWDRLFWFCPCALRQTVLEQVIAHTDIPADQIAVWDAHGMRKKNRNDDALVHIIGIETMSSSNAAVLRYAELITDHSYVVVDESTYIKGNRAKRTQRITRMSEKSRYRTILTGTPLTQGITDLYSQMQFLSEKILGYRSWYEFAAQHIQYEEKKSRYNPRFKIRTGRILQTFNRDLLAEKIEPYVYQVRKEECLDLPAKSYLTRSFDLSAEQREIYDAVKEHYLSMPLNEWGERQILGLFTDLQKVVCGLPALDLEPADNPRLDLLLETIGEIGDDEPIIIWTKYTQAADDICASLAEHFDADKIWKFTGKVSEKQRNANLANWRGQGRFLVATQAIGGHGLTLNEAAYSIFYADSFKYAERRQAEDRNHRIGQQRKAVYITLGARETIDDRIARSLVTKEGTLISFMNMVDEIKAAPDAEDIDKIAKFRKLIESL